MITFIFNLLDYLLWLYTIIVLLYVVFGWLIAYGVIDMRNQLVWQSSDVLDRLTRPALRPFRRMLPRLAGLDVSPFILLIVLYFLRDLIARVGVAIVTGNTAVILF